MNIHPTAGQQTAEKERETIQNNMIANKLFNSLKIGDALEISETYGNGKASRVKKTSGTICIKTRNCILINVGNYRKSYNINDFIGKGFTCKKI